MSRMIATNENNDIFLDPQGNLTMRTGLEGITQACENAAKAQLYEMILAYDQGVANFQTIWRDARNVAQYEAYVRRAISSVEGVTEIVDLDIVVRDNTVFYTATIATIFGRAAISIQGVTS